jgi:tRNA pseudouridine38-40 synthase
LTEYDGHAFCGWQTQAAGRTVQQVLRDALIRLTGEAGLLLTGCSRTDAGVHARGHVSHLATASRIPVERFPLALNSVLPPDIAVRAAVCVPDGFNARFDAVNKTYSYRIWHHAARPALDRHRLCHVPGPLDLDALADALPLLIGRHDFAAFKDARGSSKTSVRTLCRICLQKRGPRLTFYFQGDGFLYHMVRILTGTLLAVAQGKMFPAQVAALFTDPDRLQAGKTMPPQGLCLEHVTYEPALFADWSGPDLREGDLDVRWPQSQPSKGEPHD